MAIQISPLWVIGLSRKGESDGFIEAINKQFDAFTHSHFDFSVPIRGADKWWGINQVNPHTDLSLLITRGIPDVLLEVYTFDANAAYRQNAISVIIYADFLPVNEEADAIENMFKRLRESINTAFNSYFYFITDVLSESWLAESYKLLLRFESADACIILDECNIDTVNRNGYLNLRGNKSDAVQNINSRAAQIILNLGIGHDKLYSVVQNGKKIFASGVFSLFFEKDVLRDRITTDYLTLPILSSFFFSSNHENWHLPDYETDSLKVFKLDSGADKLYQKLVYVFDNKSKDVSGFFRHMVSPWTLFSFRLLSDYFKGELRTLLTRMVEYGRLLDARLMSVFVKHIEVKRKETKTEMLNKLRSVLLSVWENNDENRKKPIGLQQFIHHTDEMLEGLKKSLHDINSPEEFYKIYIHQMPLTPPKEIYDKYQKIKSTNQQGLMANDLAEAESRSGKEEENLLNQIRNKLHKHPIPLGLFFRAGLLGMVLAVTTYAIIVGVFPNFLINTSFFEEGAGRYLWMFLIFSSTVTSALLYYGFGILGKIRDYKKKYLAWVFHRIQQRLLTKVKENLSDMLLELIDECQRIKDNALEQLEKLRAPAAYNTGFDDNPEMNNLNRAFIPRTESLYPETYFQQNVSEPIDKTSELYFSDVIAQSDVVLSIPDHEDIQQQILTQEQLYEVMSYCLILNNNYKTLCADLISETPDLTKSVADFHAAFNGLIKLPINHIGEFQFTVDCFNTFKSRSYPSAFDYVGLSGTEIIRFTFTIGEVISNMQPAMRELVDSSADGGRKNLEIGVSPPQNCDQHGYIQVCNYYRLSAPGNIRFNLLK